MCRNPGRSFRAQTIAGFKGKPYADVAVEVIKPFVGGTIADAELKRMIARGLCGLRPSRRSRRCIEFRPGEYLLELFHGPTLAFKDVAMQLLARLMDHVLAAIAASARPIVGATSGDTGGAAVEAFRGRERVDLVILFPERTRVRRAAPDDDHRCRRATSMRSRSTAPSTTARRS